MDACRRCMPIAGPGTRISYTPEGAVITSTATTAAAASSGLLPFTVRYHAPLNDQGQSAGNPQWEIWLPPGCVSCGSTCTAINNRAKENTGHEGDADRWYVLPLDESEGTAETQGGVQVKRWHVIVHAKTSAKITGVDALNADTRNLLYVSARPVINGNITDDDWHASERGDAFSQIVSTVTITVADTTRSVAQSVFAPISVQAPGLAASGAGSNFDLVWYFSIDADTGKLELDKLYSIRNTLAVAGMSVIGDTMTDLSAAVVQGGSHKVCVKVSSNPNNGDNEVATIVDPNPTSGDDFITWLDIYHFNYGCLSGDYRLSALANVQVWR